MQKMNYSGMDRPGDVGAGGKSSSWVMLGVENTPMNKWGKNPKFSLKIGYKTQHFAPAASNFRETGSTKY